MKVKFRIDNKYSNNKFLNIKKHFKLERVLFLVLFILMLTSCTKEPIKIGFIGDLSTKNSQLAIDARNAISLSVKQINENGGVDGHDIEVIYKDDAGDPDVARIKHTEFKEEEVKYVLGHLNSSFASAIMESSGVDLMFISPSMSTTLLSGKDDFFLRSAPVNNNQADLFADYVLENNVDELVIVVDLINEAYTRTVGERVELLLEENEKPIKEMIMFDGSTDDLFEVANKIIAAEPKNVFFLSQATDSAYLIQTVKHSIEDVGTYSVSWSMTKDIISNGGTSVEGTKFVGVYIPDEFSTEYVEYSKLFEEEYGYDLSFIAVFARDALNVLVEGLKDSSDLNPEAVKTSIIEISSFEGLYGNYNIDEFGDNDRQYMMYELEQGEFIPLRDWKD